MGKKSKDRKYELADELEQHFANYNRLFMVTVDNVGSNQLHEIRKNLRGKAVIYCGKNTQMRRVLRKLEVDRPELEQIRAKLKLNVDQSQAALLQKLNLLPFAYGLVVVACYDDGSLFEPGVLSISPAQILGAFSSGCRNVAAISIMLNTPTTVSVPYSILLAFRNLLAMSATTDHEFEGSKAVKAYLAK